MWAELLAGMCSTYFQTDKLTSSWGLSTCSFCNLYHTTTSDNKALVQVNILMSVDLQRRQIISAERSTSAIICSSLFNYPAGQQLMEQEQSLLQHGQLSTLAFNVSAGLLCFPGTLLWLPKYKG